MNPPSALFGAMNRERKPFTYTPGGLDLSEIKSERMAKRLMRNAMNQGVPEVPVQHIQSPPASANPMAIPNFNCLPVQVFPTFNLPANPKSLLRTRSNPDHPKEPIQRVPSQPQFVNNKPSGIQTHHSSPYEPKQSSQYQSQQNVSYVPQTNTSQNRPASMYEYNTVPNTASSISRTNYGSDGSTMPLLPEISYEAEYFQTPKKSIINNDISVKVNEKSDDSEPPLVQNEKMETDLKIQPICNIEPVPATITKPVEDEVTSDNEQREVKVVKKQVKKEQKVENGDQNGDANVEAELVVKLPSKKSAAKTETKVEVNKTILPDGTVEEVKVTTTKTTIDGRTEIKTKTEKTIIPKEAVEEVEEEEEEQEETEVEVQEAEEPVVVVQKTVKESPVVENGHKETIVKKEEKSETTTTKKVVIVQKEESEEEEEEEEVEEPEPVVVKKPAEKPPSPKPEVEEEEEVVEEKETVKEVKKEEVVTVQVKQPEPKQVEEVEEEVEEEFEEADEEKIVEKKEEVKPEESKQQEDEESEYTEEEYESEKEEEPKETPVKAEPAEPKEQESKDDKPEPVTEATAETKEEKPAPEEEKPEPKEEKPEEPAPQAAPATEPKIPLREPSIPLEKVEDVEIKPIGPASEIISKTHTENTEIITTQKPIGPLSTQTEYSRVENIVTVNRTTKALDQSYEQMTQAGIPTVRTYFAPSRERIGTSPTPSKPYQPVYAPEAPTERRHSLLLDRLSTERQMPSDIYQNSYQYNNQSYEQQRQWSQEPQSEVLTVSNVKPSKITNSQWYQQNNRENVIYNNVTSSAPPPASTPAPANQLWNQPTLQPQYQTAPQQQYQPSPQPQYQPSPQPQYQPSQQQYQLSPQPQYQPAYTDNTAQVPSNTYQPTSYPTYAPKPNNWANNDLPTINNNLYSYSNKDATESYQKSTQQYSSSYVPPPWEQDSNYVLENSNQNYYQPPPQNTEYAPSPNQGWKPPPAKFSKPPPTAYIPPAPNQSFVKAANAAEPPRIPGRKTYYSEYERRYITVPESTYIPGETSKFQPQPDPSPQYYYDNNEPSEKVEHEWRKELREFTEKTSTQTSDQTSVRPPWEEEAKYAKAPSAYTPTPTWSQTLRPRSWRERSFESEYVGSQEVPKTNTLGRGRPLSSYAKSETPIPERVRGVSVDRYNPNNYQSPIPAEHPPVQAHTLTPTSPGAKAYHNPNVPAYHAHPRASAEPREQSVPYPQARLWGSDARDTPIQSRSFKYLQWITGTEN